MSSFVLERLDSSHDRAGFESGLESVDRCLKETARGHMEKGISVTRVLVEADANEEIVGFYTRYGFIRVASQSLRMFLPARSLKGGAEIPME